MDAAHIRRHSSTVRARGADQRELLSLAATVPFDDRYHQIYHRSYEVREPVEVRITPQELTILSFPGADRSIRMEDLQTGRAISRRYRNRRIGKFLKELDLAEGRSTGIPKILRAMRGNGSPAPVFESDDDRISFLTRLPVHEQTRLGPTGQATEHETGQVTEHDALKSPGKIPPSHHTRCPATARQPECHRACRATGSCAHWGNASLSIAISVGT